ncbi:MAG TPA: flippase [Ohtaekwangia sp.]|nr:flippase [Ohtaekwangia sp.]
MVKIFRGAVSKVRNSYWLSSASYTFLNKVSTTLFAFVNFYILIRILSKPDFGAWVLFFTVASFMEMIKHGFVRNPMIRFLTIAGADDDPKIQTASLYLNAIIGLLEVGLLVLCAMFLGDFWNSPQLESLFLIYIIATVALIPINHFDIVQQARLHFKGTFYSNLVRQGGLFIYILVIFILDYKIELVSLAYAQSAAIIVSGFASYHFAKKHIQLSPKLDKHWSKELFHYGKYTFGTNVSSTILKSVDSWMLGKLLSPAAVAVFNPAIRVSNLVEVPTDTLTSILFPQLSKRIGVEGMSSAKWLYEKAVGTLTAIMLPVVVLVIIFSSEVIYFIAGPGYEETVPILRVTMLFGLIIPFNRLMGITLDAIGKARTNFMYVLRNALINIVSNFFYISYFGTIGAAYGTLTTYLIALVYNQYYLHHNVNIRVTGIVRHFFDFYAKIFLLVIKFTKRAFSRR